MPEAGGLQFRLAHLPAEKSPGLHAGNMECVFIFLSLGSNGFYFFNFLHQKEGKTFYFVLILSINFIPPCQFKDHMWPLIIVVEYRLFCAHSTNCTSVGKMQLSTIFNTIFCNMIFKSIVCRCNPTNKKIGISEQTSQKLNNVRFSDNSTSLFFYTMPYLCNYKCIKLQYTSFHFLTLEL